MGYVTRQVGMDDPDFGKAFLCPVCHGGPELIQRALARLEIVFGDVWMYGSRKLYQHTLQDFLELPDHLKMGKIVGIDAAYDWSQQRGSPFLLLSGEPGMGKTCLASAAYIERGDAGLPIEYNALMSLLLSQQRSDNGNPDGTVRQAARVQVLFLDDVGNAERTGRETEGRLRWLFEIINYRYNNMLPTIMTTNLTGDDLYRYFDTKTADRMVEFATWINVKGTSLRMRYE